MPTGSHSAISASVIEQGFFKLTNTLSCLHVEIGFYAIPLRFGSVASAMLFNPGVYSCSFTLEPSQKPIIKSRNTDRFEH